MNQKKFESVKVVQIGRDVTLHVKPRATSGYYYLVANPKSAYGQSFVGNYDQLISKGYSALRKYYGVREADFLATLGVVA